jgi:hypothetical protein
MSAKISAAAAPAIVVSSEVVDLVRGSLLPKNSAGISSVEFYVAALAAAGISDPDSLSFAESVEVTRRLYALSASVRKDAREAAARARADEAAAREAAREAAKIEKDRAEVAALLASLAAKGISVEVPSAT